MYTRYESKPITRLAYQITRNDVITEANEEATYTLKVDSWLPVIFKATEPVKLGDYIIYLSETDIYHCDATVFAERNIVN